MAALATLAALGASYALLRPLERPPEPMVEPAAPEVPGFAFTPVATASPAPKVRFLDGAGRSLSFADFRGKVILVNFWATWCPPCRREMPTLDRLQAELGGPDFEVVALSVDRGGVPQVEAFFDELNLTNLKTYVDPTMRSLRAFRIIGLPTTVLLDRRGYEVGRLVGPAEWDSPGAIALVERAIAGGSDPRAAETGVAGRGASLPGPTTRFADGYGAVLIGVGVLVLFGVFLLTRRRAARVGHQPKDERPSAPLDDRLTGRSDPHGS